jgi:hypothetical protein
LYYEIANICTREVILTNLGVGNNVGQLIGGSVDFAAECSEQTLDLSYGDECINSVTFYRRDTGSDDKGIYGMKYYTRNG